MYGIIQIVREAIALKDTISPDNKYISLENRFGFRNYNSNELKHVSVYALDVYNDKHIWNSIIKEAMNRIIV